MPQFITFTKKIFEEMSLSTMREIGRLMGVPSPTTLSKTELEDSIMAIQNGTLTPEPSTKRGRPTKSQIDLSQYYLKEKPMDLSYSALGNDGLNILTLSDSKPRNKEFSVEGVLEILGNYGFLRVNNYENSEDDAYISMANIKKYNLRRGDKVLATVKFDFEKALGSPAVQTVEKINDLDPEQFAKRQAFDDLVPIYPNERITLENKNSNDKSLRMIDLFCPIGKGQRGLIVAPPKTGKTTLIKNIAKAIEQNHPEVILIVLLIDERPEEVTDIKKSVKGEVVFSTFDESATHHVKASELVINTAKRLVEIGKDVVVLMDSITRLARAYNNTVDSSGKVLSGGLDPSALQGPKRFFGSARNLEESGSLTIISTALIDTGSRMDDVIYEEFKGTGNMEIHLSRSLSEKRVFPAIDLVKSGTRKDELLLTNEELDCVMKLRKVLSDKPDATETLINTLEKTKSNADLISKIDEWLKIYNK